MIKKIVAVLICSSLSIGAIGCAFTDGVKQGYEDASKSDSDDNKSEDNKETKEDTQKEDNNNKDTSKEQTNTSSENKQEYKSIREINTTKVYSGTNKEIGIRAYAQYDPDTLNDEELIKFYNEKIKDSGYNYFTLVNIKDSTKGIVFSGCDNIGDSGSIDNTGSITNSEEILEIKDNEVKHIK